MNAAAQAARERPISIGRWTLWWVSFAVGITMFYIVLTPVWIGLRVLAWGAEFRARRRRPH